MSVTNKYNQFVSEPMDKKKVTAIEGIETVLGERLASEGFEKASKLLGQFLVFNKNKKLFQEWLKDKFDANSLEAENCSTCLDEWCKLNL